MVQIKMAAVQSGRGVADPDLVLHYNPPIRGPWLDDVLEARSSRLGGGGHDTEFVQQQQQHVYQLEYQHTSTFSVGRRDRRCNTQWSTFRGVTELWWQD